MSVLKFHQKSNSKVLIPKITIKFVLKSIVDLHDVVLQRRGRNRVIPSFNIYHIRNVAMKILKGIFTSSLTQPHKDVGRFDEV